MKKRKEVRFRDGRVVFFEPREEGMNANKIAALPLPTAVMRQALAAKRGTALRDPFTGRFLKKK